LIKQHRKVVVVKGESKRKICLSTRVEHKDRMPLSYTDIFERVPANSGHMGLSGIVHRIGKMEGRKNRRYF